MSSLSLEVGKWKIDPSLFLQILEPTLWCAKNHNTVLKIMGILPCDSDDHLRIKQKLLKERRYELLACMLCRDQITNPQSSNESLLLHHAGPNNPAYQKKLQGQLFSFLNWCDMRDRSAFLGKGSALEQIRIIYLMISIGYQTLFLFCISRLEQSILDCGYKTLNGYSSRKDTLFRKWVMEFYTKQPQGRQRRKLIRRLTQYTPYMFKR